MVREDFMKTYCNYGIVIRTDIDTLQKIKEYISSLEGVKILYQRPSLEKIYISQNPSDSIFPLKDKEYDE